MRKYLIFALLFFPAIAYGQNVRYDNIVLSPKGTPVSFASVAVCTQPANVSTTPCSPLATIFSTTGGAAQANPLTADINGNYHFYATPGSLYTIQIYSPQIATPFVMTDINIPPSTANTPVLSGTNAFTGNNTHSGTETFTGAVTGQNVNETLYVGNNAGQYSTCAAAITAAGSVQRVIIEVDPSYTGAACANTVTPNIIIRSIIQNGGVGNAQLYCNPASGFLNTCQAINYGFTDGNVYAIERHESIFHSLAAAGNSLSLYSLSHLQNFTANGSNQSMDGFSGEANTWGTFTGTLGILSAHEADSTIHSTGGTITNIYAVQGYANTAAASTTTIGTVVGVKGIGCNSILGSVPSNCYGIYGQDQLGRGGARNYALGFEGVGLGLYSSNQGLAGFDFEDNAHATHHILYNDSGNNIILKGGNTQGILLEDSTTANHLGITSSGVNIFSHLFANTTAVDVGTTAAPFGNLWLGTAATNNFKFQPAATAAARIVQVNDPGATSAVLLGGTNVLISPIAPTIAGAGCGGTVATISAPNGTASFNIFTGTTPGSACTITMPTATTDWHCEANHVSAVTTTNFIIQQTGALSTTSVTLTLFSDVAAATSYQASDTLRVTCTAN